MRSELAKRYFHIEKTNCLILRLKNDPSLRLICGFEKGPELAPGRPAATLLRLDITRNIGLPQMSRRQFSKIPPAVSVSGEK
jgi:hypothetical protein